MKPREFVETIMQIDCIVPGVPRLKLLFGELIAFEGMILMGRGSLDYSRHKDQKTSMYNHPIWPCHTDYTEHKNKC